MLEELPGDDDEEEEETRELLEELAGEDEEIAGFFSSLGNPWRIPDRVDVAGTLQRGNTAGLARRSLLTHRGLSVPVTRGRIPTFARNVAVYGDLQLGPFVDGARFSLLESANVFLLTLTGPELLALVKSGDRLTVPGSATSFRFFAPTLVNPARVDFGLGL